MSAAVENAEVMLSCISLSYKESANCRLEAQYAHQQRVPMVPLVMEDGYIASGWLGMLLGTKIYFNFHPAAVETDAAFMHQRSMLWCATSESAASPHGTTVCFSPLGGRAAAGSGGGTIDGTGSSSETGNCSRSGGGGGNDGV